MTRRNKRLLTSIIVAVVAILVALIGMQLISRYVMTDETTSTILTGEVGTKIEFSGTFVLGSSQVALRSVTLEPKTTKYEALSAEINLNGVFTIQDVIPDIIYELNVVTTDGTSYSGDALFFTDSTRAGYTNLVDGVDFEVSGERNQIEAELTVNDKGKINCNSAY